MIRVDLERKGHIATLVLNRPENLNALDRPLIAELHTAMREIAADRELRVVVLTGRGRAFCVGLDLKEGRGLTSATAEALITAVDALQDSLEELAIPVIAAIEGYALGSGLELALACDLRIAAEGAEFGLPEVRLGRFPGGGGTQRLPRLAGESFAREIILTGRRFGAAEAARAGLLTRIVPSGAARAASEELAATIAQNAPLGVRAAKISLRLSRPDLRGALAQDRAAWALLHDSEDYREGITAFTEKRPPNFKGR